MGGKIKSWKGMLQAAAGRQSMKVAEGNMRRSGENQKGKNLV